MKKFLSVLGVFFLLWGVSSIAKANTISFVLNQEIINTGYHLSSAPTATFEDVTGGVMMTLYFPYEDSSVAHAISWYFNSDKDLGSATLTKQTSNGPSYSSKYFSSNNEYFNSNWEFDWVINFSSTSFDENETSIFLISNVTGLTANSFNYASSGTATPQYYAGLYWEGCHGYAGDSDGFQVPEPATLLLLGCGLVGLAFTRIRKKH
jgi:hypothetical protein